MVAALTSDWKLTKIWGGALWVCSFVLGAIAVYSTGVDLIDPKLHRAGALVLSLIVALAVGRQARRPTRSAAVSIIWQVSDAIILVAGLWAIWSFYTVQAQLEEALYDVTNTDAIPALVGVAIFVELCRRIWGPALAIVSGLAVIYLLFGQNLPGLLAHAGFTIREVAESLWYNTNKGVFGAITNIVINTVFVYILFGALLEGTGAGATLLKFAFLITRRTRGGPAHAAIVASSLFGTMSGSTVANIVGTGTFTIPMIKKRGFPPAFAAGVEATASTGGQIMPPIMGAAALVMADIIGISYLVIITAALVPALFYYFSLFTSVTVEARRRGIEVQPLEVEDRITRVDLVNSIMFIVPIGVVIGSLLMGFSTSRAGFYAVVSLLILSALNPEVRREPLRVLNSFVTGGRSGATLLIGIAAIGIIVGSLDSTGLGLKLANVISDLRGDSLFSALLVAMVGALVLGMGMPTLPAYLIIVLVMGPALQQLGVSTLTAHMFVFYFGVASSLTPPVAIAAYAAAPIAGANPFATSVMAFRLGLAQFIIPFIFAFYPSLLLVEQFALGDFIWIALRSCLAIWMMSSALSAYDRSKLTMVEVALRIIGAVMLLMIHPALHLSGLILCLVLIVWDIRRAKGVKEKLS